MSAADGSSSDDDDFQFGSSNVGSKRYPVHDCCEFEDAESLRRLIFVPQDESDDDRSSGSNDSDQSSEGEDDDDSSSDDNDSAVAALAAAIGHSPRPPGILNVSMAPVGATAVAAAGMATDVAPAGYLGVDPNGNGAMSVSEPASESNEQESPTKDEAGYQEKVKELGAHTGVSPSIDGNMNIGEGSQANKADTSTVLMDTSSNVPVDQEQDANMVSEQETGTPRISIMIPAATEGKKKVSKKQRKKLRKKRKEPTYYCPYDLNERDEDENTALHVAIHARKLEHVKLLLLAGASVHKKSDGSAPLHLAISIGAVPMHAAFAFECTVILGENDADFSVKDDSMHTPLYLACAMNLPQVVSHILRDDVGLSTLNMRADRSGGRALHASAKFDSLSSSGYARGSKVSGDQARAIGAHHHHHHHPDGTISHSSHHIPGLHDAPGKFAGKTIQAVAASSPSEAAAVVTEILLSTPGIEIDAQNSNGQTPLHVACSRGNWLVVRLLLRSGASPDSKDKRGLTPGQLAVKRGMPIPADLLLALGGTLTSTHGTPRDLIMDPDSPTVLICHELCLLHRSCPPIRRDSAGEPPPPENIRRLHVLINGVDGILKGGEFRELVWEDKARRASMVDVLKVHEYNYVESISRLCAQIPDHPQVIQKLDGDTTVSHWSFEAALRAAGSVCDAVDKVVAGDVRNAFCAVRPPGHHAGPRGIVKCANDPEGSHGFCLLNNVAIGAAYARSMYRNDGIQKIAIIDFDVHHGNGTEEIIRQLVPNVETTVIRTPFALAELSNPRYRPWLDETDINDVFFSSTHGYGPRTLDLGDHPQQGGMFYPSSGETHVSDAIVNPSVVETPSHFDFILSQSWTRIGEDSRANCCKIINCGLDLPRPDAIPGMQRLELRDTYRKKILPYLRDFDPDIIFVSAGFDAHKRDSMNYGYVGMVEDDYEWVTEQLVKIANTCCNGRIVSVLEGGYKIHGGIVSPFARSVASHVRALVDGGRSRELFDPKDCNWESQFERHVVEDRELKRQQKKEDFIRMTELSQRRSHLQENSQVDNLMKEPLNDAAVPMEHPAEEPSRKRRRNQVDYRELFEQMKREKS